jgi:hypothetical protein
VATKKYRPYFTLEELQVLLESAQSGTPAEVAKRIGIIRYLSKYISDIEAGFRAANYTKEPTIEEKLGFVEEKPLSAATDPINLHRQYLLTGFIGMTPAQIEIVQAYRYESDLMEDQEEADYEKAIGLTFGG